MMRKLLAGAALAGCMLAAVAQDAPFPQRGPIEITVLFSPGSSADITARLLADGMARQLSTSVIIVNRPGAGGAIGYRHVAEQRPDGYSLVWNSNSVSTTYYAGQMPFDYHAFEPVARVLTESPVLAVRGNARWKTLAQFLADAKAHPGRLTVANSGVGSHTHITSVALFKAAGVRVVDVPYPAAQVVPSVIGGHVDAMLQLPAALAEQVKTGQVRVLAAMVDQRDPALPRAPTAREQGVDVSLAAWRGIAVPKGTPPAVIARLQEAIRKTVQSPDFARACERLGVHPAYLPAREFGELIAKDDVELGQLMQEIGLRK